MTVLDFTLSRTASRDWKEGDRILVSRLDHDGGVAPWVELAEDRGFVVDWIDVSEDLRLDFDDLERKLDDRVRVVACVASSNAVGTIVDVARVAELAHSVGALCWVDAVQYAAHEPVDVQALGCDVFLCSAYKFCGPHLGLAYGRHELLESWRPYKARPAAARSGRPQVRAGHGAVRAPRRVLRDDRVPRVARRHAGARRRTSASSGSASSTGSRTASRSTGCRRWRAASPTFLLNVDGVPAEDVVRRTLAERGFGVWAHDNWFSLGLREKLPYPRNAVRVGCIHYNTTDEIDRFIAELAKLGA